MKESEDKKEIPVWKLEKIEDTFRQVANALNSYDRGSCLSRDIMECWNWIYDIMHDVSSEETSKNGVMYRLRVGQRPGDNNTRYENGKK